MTDDIRETQTPQPVRWDEADENAQKLADAQDILYRFCERYHDHPFIREAGRMTVVRLLGRGGFGEVYQIADDHERRHALKIFSSKNSGDFDRKNREITTRTKIADVPFLMPYRCYGTLIHEKNWYLIIMPYFEATCSAYERVTPYDEGRALELGIDISLALSACHEQKIIHRDVKPGNIFVRGPRGVSALPAFQEYLQSKRWPLFILGDFGNAKDTANATGNTRTIVMGSPGFEPPEICRTGEIPRETHDIYSLGATLYWCANWNADNTQNYATGGTDTGSRFIQKPADASEELWEIIQKATQVDPSKRYPTALALREDLIRLRDERLRLEREKDSAWRSLPEKDGRIRSLTEGNAELKQALERAQEENKRALAGSQLEQWQIRRLRKSSCIDAIQKSATGVLILDARWKKSPFIVRDRHGKAVLAMEDWSKEEMVRFDRQTSGYYTITSLGSGRCLDVKGQGRDNGTVVQFCEPNGTDAQLWQVESTDWNHHHGPLFCLSPKCAHGAVLDVGISPEENLTIWDRDGDKTRQIFRFWQVSAQDHINKVR